MMPFPESKWDGDPDTLDLAWVARYVDELRSRDKARFGDCDNEEDEDYRLDLEPLVEFYRRFLLGNWLALIDAFHFSKDDEVPTPQWIVEGLVELTLILVSGTSLGERGRGRSVLGMITASVKTNLRRTMFARIRLVQPIKDDLFMPVLAPREVLRAIREGRLGGIGTSIEDALTALEKGLQGTFAQASLGTLRRDYRRWGNQDHTFTVEMPETLEALGFSVLDEEEEIGAYGFEIGLPDNMRTDQQRDEDV